MTVRPKRDGTPDEQRAYWEQIDRIVARDQPRPAEFWARIGVRVQSGLTHQKDKAA